MRYSPTRRVMVIALAAAGVLAGANAAHAQKKLGIFGSGDIKYSSYRDTAGRFEIEQPSKDWNLMPAGGSLIAVFAHKDLTATLNVDLAPLTEALSESEIMINAKIEVETLKEQNPNAKDFTSELFDSRAGKGALIKYSRVGSKGAEKVMRYLVGVERNLYRLDGIVQIAAAAKLEPVLMHMIQSFKAPAGPPATKN